MIPVLKKPGRTGAIRQSGTQMITTQVNIHHTEGAQYRRKGLFCNEGSVHQTGDT